MTDTIATINPTKQNKTDNHRVCFNKANDSLFVTAKTPLGHQISFVKGRESGILCVDSSSILEPRDQPATRLILYCNFRINQAQKNYLEDYGVLCNLELTNENKQLCGYPLINFSYEEFFDMICDWVVEFNL